jgi:phosphate transport system permease protein
MGTRRPDDAPSEASDLRAEQADAPQPELDRTPAQWPVLVGSGQPLAIAGGDEIDGPVDSAATLASGGRHRLADRVFFFLTAGSGGFVVLLIALVAVFLVGKAVPSIGRDSQSFLFSRGFSVSNGQRAFGVADLLWVTFITSAIAMVLAVPISVGIALFLTQYAPAPLRRPVAATIDLLAAIPSIIYGIWGIFVLAPELEPVQRVLYHVGFIPLFKDAGVVRGTIFDAGVVLAVMILPIITAIARDVFDRTPAANIEAALALGATKWETIRMAVLPYGRPGVISGAMLGLGRALGETIAVLLILTKPSPSTPFSFSIFAGGQTFASLIGQNMKEAQGPFQTGAYIAAGLVLFVLTFLVNAAARAVVARGTEYS